MPSKQAKNRNLVPTVKMMNSFLQVLTKMERIGFLIDLECLSDVESKFKDVVKATSSFLPTVFIVV